MDDIKSKSQKKRDAAALQHFGTQLIALSLDDLQSLPLSEPLLRAICEAKALKSHGAVKRQSQLVGKLMRAIDHEALSEAFEAMQAEDRAQTAQFHAAEAWRDKLLQGGAEALTVFVESFKPDNVQLLRQLIKKAQASTSPIQQKTAYTALFRYIKQCL